MKAVPMRTLAIDIETYSAVDIHKCGLYKYAENCEILLFAYAYDDEPVQIVDVAMGEALPEQVRQDLTSDSVKKTAFNATFEMTVLRKAWGIAIKEYQWECTMVASYRLGLPGSLKMVGKALHLPQEEQKDAQGARLIAYFCKPYATHALWNRNQPEQDPTKWAQFKAYNKQDVEAERAIRKKLAKYSTTKTEVLLWAYDLEINGRGVKIDTTLVREAIAMDEELRADTTQKLQTLTGLANPKSLPQMRTWLTQRLGYSLDTLDKNTRKELLAKQDLPQDAREAIEGLELLNKTSVRKYSAMQNAKCKDNRVRGMLQYYGAARTGRWAGRIVQLHNLPQNHLDDLDFARGCVLNGNGDALDLFYDSRADVLSQLIRTAFIPKDGCTFAVADFSAIEARVIAWLAGEQWVMDAFHRGEDIYCETASKMFGVPVKKHGINGELRQKGKIATLACGYGGNVDALKAFGANKMGLSENDMAQIIRAWRNANPRIVRLWSSIEQAFKSAIQSQTHIKLQHGIEFFRQDAWLFVKLPSGRKLAYVWPHITPEGLSYEGSTVAGQWGEIRTWGGKLTENLVQAIARDCLGEVLIRLHDNGFQTVMHIHDEVVCEVKEDSASKDLALMLRYMAEPIPWAEGLELKGDGYITPYYKKD